MNIARSIVLIACTLCALLTTGCIARPIEAASTRLKVQNVTGKSVEITLPKNLDATGLVVTANPATGVYELRAQKMVTDASTVIDSAAAAQAQALASLSSTLNALVPLIAQIRAAAPSTVPAAPPPKKEEVKLPTFTTPDPDLLNGTAVFTTAE